MSKDKNNHIFGFAPVRPDAKRTKTKTDNKSEKSNGEVAPVQQEKTSEDDEKETEIGTV